MSNMIQYAQLNIGRNMGAEPMDSTLWLAFIQQASHALAHAAGEHRMADAERWQARIKEVQVHSGTGDWDGVPEDSAHVSLFAPDGIDVDKLRELAAILAAHYGQEAIALIVGSELVSA